MKKHTPSPFAASLACIVMLYSFAIRVSAQYPITLIYSESHSQTQADDEYRIKPKDVLYLEIEGVCLFSPRRNVDDRGTLPMPLIGKVRAADRTVVELENEITEKLKEYLTEPKVYIQVAERAPKD